MVSDCYYTLEEAWTFRLSIRNGTTKVYTGWYANEDIINNTHGSTVSVTELRYVNLNGF